MRCMEERGRGMFSSFDVVDLKRRRGTCARDDGNGNPAVTMV